jgi:hypothetical protein
MIRRAWLHHILGQFSRPLLSHRSHFLLYLFYWAVMCNVLLLHISSKQLIKCRADSAEPARHHGSVLLPSTCFRMLWSDGLRPLLLLVVCGPSSVHSRTVRACLVLVPRPFGVRRQVTVIGCPIVLVPRHLRSFFCLEPFE